MATDPATAASRPSRRRWSRRLLALLIGTVMSLVAAELAATVFVATMTPRLTQRDDRLGWVHRPNVVRAVDPAFGSDGSIAINEHGNRGPAHPYERQPGRYRVLALGDSFTEGLQVGEERLFTALLEHDNAGFEVINAGVGSYGTVQELLYFRDQGRHFRPDVVLLMVYVNDLTDNLLAYSPGVGPRPYAERGPDGTVRIVEDYDDASYLKFCAPAPFQSFLSHYSRLYQAFNQRVWQVLRADQVRALFVADKRHFSVDECLSVFEELLVRLRDDVKASGARLAVAAIPPAAVLRDDGPYYGRRVAAMCQRHDIPFRSLRAALQREYRAGRQPYFSTDIHWTALGHRVAARVLAPFLTELRQ